jgi:transposase-like protein
MEGRQRRSFTDDYKQQAVDLVAHSLTHRCQRLGEK